MNYCLVSERSNEDTGALHGAEDVRALQRAREGGKHVEADLYLLKKITSSQLDFYITMFCQIIKAKRVW